MSKKTFWEYIEEAYNLPELKGKCEILDMNGHRWYMSLAEVAD